MNRLWRNVATFEMSDGVGNVFQVNIF